MREGAYNKSENIPLFTIEENDDIDYNYKYEVNYTENDSLFSLEMEKENINCFHFFKIILKKIHRKITNKNITD